MSGSDADLRNWIRSVRGKDSKSSFSGNIYHYQVRQGEMVCLSYGRATVTNWESGATSPPRDVETILSIALVEYDKAHKDEFPSNERYFFARKRLNKMLGLDLWCRNLHDALLIQVCRGILSFKKLIEEEDKLLSVVKKTALTNEEKDELAVERRTEAISEDLIHTKKMDDVRLLIEKDYRSYFAAQHWLAGARVRRIYERRNRFHDLRLPLKTAVVNLAPNYSNSFNNMFNGSFLGREWLFDLCRHLRFDRDEINEVMEATHNVMLSDNEDLPEPFGYFRDRSLSDKLRILLLVGLYLYNLKQTAELPPIDYILDPFRPGYESGRSVMRQLDKYVDECLEDLDDKFVEPVELPAQEFVSKWKGIVERVKEEELFSYEIWDLYIEETPFYYSPEKAKTAYLTKVTRKFILLHFFAALSFTILTGRPYMGKYRDSDLDEIRVLFTTGNPLFAACDSLTRDDFSVMYGFVSQILATFLSPARICEKNGEKYYVFIESKGKWSGGGLDLESVIDSLWESIIIIKEAELALQE